jgi:hypothetical protein
MPEAFALLAERAPIHDERSRAAPGGNGVANCVKESLTKFDVSTGTSGTAFGSTRKNIVQINWKCFPSNVMVSAAGWVRMRAI